jgi:hypothetical protein
MDSSSDDELLFERTRSGSPIEKPASRKATPARSSGGGAARPAGLLESERHNPQSPWVAYADETSGTHYYHNAVTGETSWAVPSEGVARFADGDDGDGDHGVAGDDSADDVSSRSDASDLSERSASSVGGPEDMCLLVRAASSRMARPVELEVGMTLEDILDECCVETGHNRADAQLLLDGGQEVSSYDELQRAASRDRQGLLQCNAELVSSRERRHNESQRQRREERPSASASAVRDALASSNLPNKTSEVVPRDRREKQPRVQESETRGTREPRSVQRLLPARRPGPPTTASPYSRGKPGRGPYLRQPAVRPAPPAGQPTPPLESFAEVVTLATAKKIATAGPERPDERAGLAIGTVIHVDGHGEGSVVTFHRNKVYANEHSVDFAGKIFKLNLLKETWSIPAPKISAEEQLERQPGFRYEVRTEFLEAGRTGFDLEENSAGLATVRRIRPKSKAAAVLHACEGMRLVRVQAGNRDEISTEGMSYESVEDMMPDRPLVLIWEHPWQQQLDQLGDGYYFNSITEESRRDRPEELAGVVAAMMKWKHPNLAGEPAPRQASARSGHTVDEAAAGFAYEVKMEFTTPGSLGLVFNDYKGSALVTKMHSGGLAAAMPHACEGLVVARVKVDMQQEQSAAGLGFDGVMDLISTKARPLWITFTHPWQRQKTEKGEVYYFNSATEGSSWDRPDVLEGVLASMQLWSQPSEPPSLAKADSPKPTAPKVADIEGAPGFRYELRTYEHKTAHEKSGLLGFKYSEGEDGAAIVKKIKRMTPAASLENGCEGMVLVRVKAGKAKEKSVASLDFEHTLKLLEQRPLRLTFEHPWQKEQDDSGKPYFYNSWTGESRWDRPGELGPVVEAMRDWYGAAESQDQTLSPSPSSPQPEEVKSTALLDDKAADFCYEVRTEFTKPGRLGFEFDEKRKRVRVKNVHGGTPAASQPLVCVGMYLSRIRCGDQVSELLVSDLGFDRVMDMMADRPLVLVFEHPWQRIDDQAEPYYYNSRTDESRWDRPPELEAVLAAMKTWKHPDARGVVPAADPAPVQVQQSVLNTALDESVPGFMFEVQMTFANDGSLGFDLEENPDKQTIVQRVKKGTVAAADPLSCAGMILLRVKSGSRGVDKDVSDGSVPLDGVIDMLGDRPLTLTFAHPWQAMTEGSETYYYNTLTDESVWERPKVLDRVAEAMRAWKVQTAAAAPRAGIAATQHAQSPGAAGAVGASYSLTPRAEMDGGGGSSGSGERAARAVDDGAMIDSDLPAIGTRVEVYSVSEGKWYPGRVTAHIGKSSQPGSSSSDIMAEYKHGSKQKILSWRDTTGIRLLEEEAAGAAAASPGLRLEAASPAGRLGRTKTTDGIECQVLGTISAAAVSAAAAAASASSTFARHLSLDHRLVHCAYRYKRKGQHDDSHRVYDTNNMGRAAEGCREAIP